MLEEYEYTEQPSGRVDTLVQAIERIERLEKQLEVAVDALEKGVILSCHYFPIKTAKQDAFSQLKTIQKQLGLALQQIKELENAKD